MKFDLNFLKLKHFIGLLVVAESLLAFYAILDFRTNIAFSTRYSGLLSMLIFLGIFIVCSNANTDRRKNPIYTQLVSVLALNHFVHLIFIGFNMQINPADNYPLAKLFGGILAYFLILIMPFAIKIPKLPIWIDHLYLYYIGLIFIFTYISRINSPLVSNYHYFALFLIIVVSSFHFYSFFKPKS